ncbi:MAG: tripartite tricarboxylate transporter substrate binding protein [Casimicrobiaceae bacterium]
MANLRLLQRTLLLTALASGALAWGHVAGAESWPSRPIILTVVSPSGSAPDSVARDLVARIGLALGQPIVIENMAGAGGILGMQQVRNAKPDGYRFVFTHNGAVVINPALFKALSYDPVRDFEPVSLVLVSPMILVATSSLGVGSLEQLLALSKRKPGTLMYGSAGIGTPPHVFVEQVKSATSLDMDHVPFKGSPGVVQGLMGGHVGVGMEGAAAVMPLIEAGKVRALAVSGDARMEILPQVPTFAELGVPDIGFTWLAIMAPKGTPADAVAALNRELTRVLALPDLRRSWGAFGRKVGGGPPELLAERIRTELPRWRNVIERAAIRAE